MRCAPARSTTRAKPTERKTSAPRTHPPELSTARPSRAQRARGVWWGLILRRWRASWLGPPTRPNSGTACQPNQDHQPGLRFARRDRPSLSPPTLRRAVAAARPAARLRSLPNKSRQQHSPSAEVQGRGERHSAKPQPSRAARAALTRSAQRRTSATRKTIWCPPLRAARSCSAHAAPPVRNRRQKHAGTGRDPMRAVFAAALRPPRLEREAKAGGEPAKRGRRKLRRERKETRRTSLAPCGAAFRRSRRDERAKASRRQKEPRRKATRPTRESQPAAKLSLPVPPQRFLASARQNAGGPDNEITFWCPFVFPAPPANPAREKTKGIDIRGRLLSRKSRVGREACPTRREKNYGTNGNPQRSLLGCQARNFTNTDTHARLRPRKEKPVALRRAEQWVSANREPLRSLRCQRPDFFPLLRTD